MADQRRPDYPLADYPWYEIKGWAKHQHARAEQGRYIANKTKLLVTERYRTLGVGETALLHRLWLLRGLTGENPPRDHAALRSALGLPPGRWLGPALETLERRRWIIPRKTKLTGQSVAFATAELPRTNLDATHDQPRTNSGKKVRVPPDAKRGATIEDRIGEETPLPPTKPTQETCGFCAGKGTMSLPDKPGLISPCACDLGRQIVATAEALHEEQAPAPDHSPPAKAKKKLSEFCLTNRPILSGLNRAGILSSSLVSMRGATCCRPDFFAMGLSRETV